MDIALNNINSIPPSCMFEQRPHELAFGRPVQPMEQVSKQLPLPDRVRLYPLPADQHKREQIFVKACHAGNVAEVQHLLCVAPGLTAYKDYSELIDQAIEKNDSGMLDLLLEYQNGGVFRRLGLLDLAIRKAVQGGHTDIVRSLLKREENRHPWAALIRVHDLTDAVSLGHREIVALLVQAGGELNAHSGELKGTPLSFAAKRGDRLMVEQLLELGADPNQRAGNYNNGHTPLAWACDNGDLPTAKVLVKAGAIVDRVEYRGYTALSIAVRFGYEEVARYLLQMGADVNAAGDPQNTPLYMAVKYCRFDLLKKLLQAGAAPDLLFAHEVEDTPLMLAVRKGEVALVEPLLNHGADIHKTGAKQFSALEQAVRGPFGHIAAMLRAKAAQPGAQP